MLDAGEALRWAEDAALQKVEPHPARKASRGLDRRVRKYFVLGGSLEDYDEPKLQGIVEMLRTISGDASLVLRDLKPGSVKLVLEGDPIGLERLEFLFDTGQLQTILGVEVIGIDDMIDWSLPAKIPSSHESQRARSLDQEVLERLKLKLRYKILYHLGLNCPDVDDLVQETITRFLRAENAGQIRNTDESGAFLNGICRNVILEYRRRQRPINAGIGPETARPESNRTEGAEIRDMRDAIERGLIELSQRDRAVLRALYVDGWDQEEVCRELGITHAQFRVILVRAKRRFLDAWKSSAQFHERRGR